MTDSLRTRTWRALEAHGLGWIDNGNPDIARCWCGYRPRLGESWHMHVADVLIRELNLANACLSGCVWQIPDRIEDMTEAQREMLSVSTVKEPQPMSDFDVNSSSSLPPKSPQSDDLRTRIAAVLYRLWQERFPRSSPWEELSHDEREPWLTDADVVIRALTDTIPRPVEAEVNCGVCGRTYSVRADAPGWSAVWTCCIGCQASEENEWLRRGPR